MVVKTGIVVSLFVSSSLCLSWYDQQQERSLYEWGLKEHLIRVCGRLTPHHEQEAWAIQRDCGIERDILYLKADKESWGATGMQGGLMYMRIHDGPRRYIRIFTLYHEMGHIFHRDFEVHTVLRTLGDEGFKRDMIAINRQIRSAKKVVLGGSILGGYLKKQVKRFPVLWKPPADTHRGMLHMEGRCIEQRADLFAFKHLYDIRDIEALCGMLYTFCLSDYTVSDNDRDLHPSDLERGLALIGFLIESVEDV